MIYVNEIGRGEQGETVEMEVEAEATRNEQLEGRDKGSWRENIGIREKDKARVSYYSSCSSPTYSG